jgi:hypothetical protein
MTLKERLKEEPIVLYKDSYNMTNQSAESLEVIADEYAIGFAAWIHSNAGYAGNECYGVIGHIGLFKLPKVLEIYKKEKDL